MKKSEIIDLLDETSALMWLDPADEEAVRELRRVTGCSVAEVHAAAVALTVAANVLRGSSQLDAKPSDVAATITSILVPVHAARREARRSRRQSPNLVLC